MTRQFHYGWTVWLIGSLILGCSTAPDRFAVSSGPGTSKLDRIDDSRSASPAGRLQDSETIRGQSPHVVASGPRGIGPVGHGAGPAVPAGAVGGVCPHGWAGGCDVHGGFGAGAHSWTPTHSHWFDYERPRHLVYPPANQPTGVIQYPYYTVKGPTDFFFE